MENWAWLPQEIKAMSRHYTRVNPAYADAWRAEHPGQDLPSEQIPEELFEEKFAQQKLTKTKRLLSWM